MKIGIKYGSFYDSCGLLYALAEGEISYIKNKTFVIRYQNDEYLFSQNFVDLKDVDKTIILINALHEFSPRLKQEISTNVTSPYKVLQMQIIENYHCSDQDIRGFLDKGNIILSSATINFTHKTLCVICFSTCFFYITVVGITILITIRILINNI